jgi:hypothetical protein
MTSGATRTIAPDCIDSTPAWRSIGVGNSSSLDQGGGHTREEQRPLRGPARRVQGGRIPA